MEDDHRLSQMEITDMLSTSINNNIALSVFVIIIIIYYDEDDDDVGDSKSMPRDQIYALC